MRNIGGVCKKHTDTKPTHAFLAARLKSLYYKYSTLGNYPNGTRFCEIRIIGGFEDFGAYEDWGIGWQVRINVLTRGPAWHGQFAQLDTPIVVEDACLVCAIDEALERAKELETE